MFTPSHSRPIGWLLLVGLVAAGCGGDGPRFTSVKQIDQKVTLAELKAFVQVIRALPDDRLPALPALFVPPAEWSPGRTLPVGELVNEERNLIDEHWSPAWLARHLEDNRPLARALRRERMTAEQFAGLTLAVGVALARAKVPGAADDLRGLVKSGHAAIERLAVDSRPFSSLSRADQYHVLQQAAWITRVDRIERLMQVPPENLDLVQRYRKTLQPLFPAEFNSNPLMAVTNRLEEQGVPFEELAASGSDALIEWDVDDAIIGHDAPDDMHGAPRSPSGSGTALGRAQQ